MTEANHTTTPSPDEARPTDAAERTEDEERLESSTGDAPAPASDEAVPAPAPSEAGAGDGSDEVSELRAERDRYLELLRRVQAEFDNSRKRIRRDHGNEAARAAGDVMARLLPTLDAMDAAAQHHVEVVRPLQGALQGAFEQVGLERLDPVGEPFDPNLHEAVEWEADEGPEAGPPHVSRVLRPGYRFKGRLLRPAMVAVGEMRG